MSSFDVVRQHASRLHHDVATSAAQDINAFVDAVANHLGLDVLEVPAGHAVLRGARALFDPASGSIVLEQVANAVERALLIAHEIGHSVLHALGATCASADIDLAQGMDAPPVGMARVDDYGARERRELEANVFARELLLPREQCLALYVEQGLSSTEIARLRGLPVNMVRQQLLDAVLLPPVEPVAQTVRAPAEDPSQAEAARHWGAPLLLQAGPGTGKTSTLVARVRFLMEKHVHPSSVVVLTFSNRAAGELTERLAQHLPEEAPKIWIGTFHAFGLELLRRHYDRLGLPPDPVLFDRSDAIDVLQDVLPTLNLKHYRNLWDPVMTLKDIVQAISRAKDELVDPLGYRQLADAMLRRAGEDADLRKAAERCLEVATVYELYENALRARGAVDFGDLILRPARLLETDPDVRATVQLRHRHVLVDEFQDVNRACGRLLRALCGDGARLWAVGDARQSIYRFRGASTSNLTRFAQDYPSAQTKMLAVNYRSSQEVVDAFSAVAREMSASAGMLPLSLTARRGSVGPRPRLMQYETLDDEVAGLAAEIRALAQAGTAFRDQAVLCRSNGRLNDIAASLERAGIPVLHLGSFFEREDVRDVLAVLSLRTDALGDALVRVACRPRYGVPLQDVHQVLRALRTSSATSRPALAAVVEGLELTDPGRAGLLRLAADLETLDPNGAPWEVAAAYILDCARDVERLAIDPSIAARTSGIALWQLMNFLREQPIGAPAARIPSVLARLRQLVLLAEERDLRQMPPAALALDAVRLMTIHGSKGLEFEAVHIPGVTTSSIPASPKGQRCPPPGGMIEVAADGADDFHKRAHAQEEECLFFVALSRARTHLRLYQARKTSDGKNRSTSPYLRWLPASCMDTTVDGPTIRIDRDDPRAVALTLPVEWTLTDQRLVAYDQCPRRFFYTHVLGLAGGRQQTAFSRTHDCVHSVLRWFADARRTNTDVPSAEAVQAALERIWGEKGPVDHAYAREYQALAVTLATTLIDATLGPDYRSVDALAVDLQNGRVLVEPFDVRHAGDGSVTVRRVRTGQSRKDESDRLEYAFYLLGVQAAYGPMGRVEVLHLADGVSESIKQSERKLQGCRERSEKHLVAIREGAFPAKSDAATCPRCPHFFICPATPEGELVVS